MPGKLYKIGKLFGALGGQGEIFEKNLKPVATAARIPAGELKAVPDDEMDPREAFANNMKRAQKRQALMSIVCCIASLGIMVLFWWITSGF
jgi:hypothetical protein